MRWSHVVIELLLLITGILVALAVDGWIDDRRDARLERAYLERLEQDLERNLAILDEFVDFEQRQTADGVLAYRALRGVSEMERERVAQALSNLANRRTLRLLRATYQDLLSTGNLSLVRDQMLRDAIVRLYEEADRTIAIVDRNNEVVVEQAYGQPLHESGLITPRFPTNLPWLEAQLASLRDQIDLPVDPVADRLWQLPADSAELQLLTNRVLRRTIVSKVTYAQVEALRVQFRAMHQDLVGKLASDRSH
jgi:hypothetical protein